jgi:hypothetical protein
MAAVHQAIQHTYLMPFCKQEFNRMGTDISRTPNYDHRTPLVYRDRGQLLVPAVREAEQNSR